LKPLDIPSPSPSPGPPTPGCPGGSTGPSRIPQGVAAYGGAQCPGEYGSLPWTTWTAQEASLRIQILRGILGFDTKIMRQIIRLRKMEPNDRQEQEELLDIYMRAVGMMV